MAKRTPRSQAQDAPSVNAPAQTPPRPKLVRKAGRAVASPAPMRPTAIEDPAVTDDDIRQRAYLRYLERGGGDGADFDDWLYAERELKKR